MRRNKLLLVMAIVVSVCVLSRCRAQEAAYTRIPNVVYGRADGVPLTLDVFKPAKPSGIGVLWMMSGGWVSAPGKHPPALLEEFFKHGQTVFGVVHRSQPQVAIPEISREIIRAVRFVRTHAAEYGVDPNRLGISGASSGGHLSLITAARGGLGDPQAPDPVDRASSALQAVGCFYPPTDFLDYGQPGISVFSVAAMKPFLRALGAKSEDPAALAAAARAASPITYFTKEMPPTLILHGDADLLVPIQQSQVAMQRLDELGVRHRLVVRPGKSHGWPGLAQDIAVIADWFDEVLGRK